MFKFSYIRVCKELVHADLIVFKKDFVNKCIDLIIWVVLNLAVVTYILPYFGLSNEFGVFQLGGILAAAPLFELYGNVVALVSDFRGNRVIDYNLTLPIPSWMALMSKVVYYAISYIVITIIMLPVAKLFFWQKLDLTQISFIKLALITIFQSILYASFVLFPASLVKDIAQMRTVWARFIFPMWIMGGFQFSWMALHKALPLVAYINLFNPMMYITEALRTSLLGQEGYINFWLCLLIIILFSACSLYVSLRNLKRTLDYV